MKTFKELFINEDNKIEDSNINKGIFTFMKEFMKKQGSIGWEFEGDYETLKITFKDNATAVKAFRASNNSSSEISAFGDAEVANAVITVELNDDAKKALNN